MTPLETEADPNIRVGPLRWGRPVTLEFIDHFAKSLAPFTDQQD